MNLFLSSVFFWNINIESEHKNLSNFWTNSFIDYKYISSPYFFPSEMSRLSGGSAERNTEQWDTIYCSCLVSYMWRSFDTVCKQSSRCRKVHPSCAHVRSDGCNIFPLESRNHRNPTVIIREINFRLNSFQKQDFIEGETTGAFTNEICNTSLCDFEFHGRLPRTGYYFKHCMMVCMCIYTSQFVLYIYISYFFQVYDVM